MRLTRALQAVPDQLAAMKALADQGLGDLKTASLLLELKGIDDELKELTVTLGANRTAVQADAEALRDEAAAAALLAAELTALGDAFSAAATGGGRPFALFADDKFIQTLVDANKELRALKATTDLDAESIRRFGVSFEALDTSTQQSLLSLRQWNAEASALKGAEAFAKSLTGIAAQAQLLGPSFDEAGAKLQLFKQRYLELAAIQNPTAEIVQEMATLKQQFQDTQTFIQWRTTFESVFNSVGDAVNKLVTGVIQGTQTMGQAFKNLAQAIIINFVNAVIQQALNPLVKAAAHVVAGPVLPGWSRRGCRRGGRERGRRGRRDR